MKKSNNEKQHITVTADDLLLEIKSNDSASLCNEITYSQTSEAELNHAEQAFWKQQARRSWQKFIDQERFTVSFVCRSFLAIFIYWSLTFSQFFSAKLWSTYIFVPFYFKSGIHELLLKISAGEEKILLSYQNMYFQNIIYFTLFILIVPLFWKEIKQGIKLSLEKTHGMIYIPIIHFVSMLLTAGISSVVNIFVTLPETSVNQEMIEESMEVSILGNIFPTLIAAPFVEEIIFRVILAGLVYYIVFSMISRRNEKKMSHYIISAVIAVIVSTIGFALLHVVGADKGDYLAMLPYIISGLLYTSFYFITKKNIFYVILMHMYNNVFSLVMFWIASIKL